MKISFSLSHLPKKEGEEVNSQTKVLQLKQGWDGVGDGRADQKGVDICIPMVDSCRGLTENNKILERNYPSIKKNKLKRQ